MDLVALPLSNPLMPNQAQLVGAADVRMYAAGETINVPATGAMTIIRAGWAQVNPNDPEAVAKALAVTVADPSGAPGSSPAVVPAVQPSDANPS